MKSCNRCKGPVKKQRRGVCGKCDSYIRRHPEESHYLDAPLPKRLNAIKYLGCKIKGCPNEHRAKGYCLMHYTKFSEKRKVARCKRCRGLGELKGRRLCHKCWMFCQYHDLLDRHPLTKYKVVKIFNTREYTALERWLEVGTVNSTKFCQQVMPELRMDTAARYYERLKKKIKLTGLPHMRCDQGEYTLMVTREELYKFNFRRVKK